MAAFLISCQSSQVYESPGMASIKSQDRISAEKHKKQIASADYSWTTRVITDQQILEVSHKDPALTPVACREILARLNARARYHISDDIRKKHPLKVPNDFAAYKGWTPLPQQAPGLADFPKSILIVKELPYIGWYERGRLVGDSYACVGKPGEDTEVGVYRVLDKDPDHVSRSYSNSYGSPAWMPWAMRIYDHVWIHAGDVTGPYCSHGCIIVPLDPAQDVYRWGDLGITVVVIDSLNDIPIQQRPKLRE